MVAAQTSKARKRTILVGAREPAVADNIRDQDRREFPGLAHSAPPAVGGFSPRVEEKRLDQ
jgi:hypothetical protein